MKIPKSHYAYEFSYPENMPELAGIIFYVGKGTSTARMDHHFVEATNGCDCDKCKAIRSIWNAGLIVVRRIVFESDNEHEVLQEEKIRIARHQSLYLTNIIGGGGNKIRKKAKNTGKRNSSSFVRSFEKDGETWVCMTEAFKMNGTRILHLADEYGLTTRVRDSVTYWRKSDLPTFFDWVRTKKSIKR